MRLRLSIRANASSVSLLPLPRMRDMTSERFCGVKTSGTRASLQCGEVFQVEGIELSFGDLYNGRTACASHRRATSLLDPRGVLRELLESDEPPIDKLTIMKRTGFLGDLISWEDGVYGTSESVFSGGA